MEKQVEPTIRKIEDLIEGFYWMLPNLGIGLLVFLFFVLAAAGGRLAVSRALRRRGNPDLGALLGAAARWGILLLGLLVVATIVFPSIKPADLLATLGIGSVAVGFAFKDILQNWLSGLLILYRRPFRPGDQIVSGGFEGTVEQIQARATLLRTYDGDRVSIPNSDIYTRAITVRTAYPLRCSEHDVGIGYGDDPATACRVIVEALKGLDSVSRDPPPDAIPWALDGSSLNIRVRWWTDSRRSSVVHARGEVIAAIRNALGKAAIDLPFPTRVVLFHDQTEETDGDRSRQREGWPAGRDPPPPRHLDDLQVTRTGTGSRPG